MLTGVLATCVVIGGELASCRSYITNRQDFKTTEECKTVVDKTRVDLYRNFVEFAQSRNKSKGSAFRWEAACLRDASETDIQRYTRLLTTKIINDHKAQNKKDESETSL